MTSKATQSAQLRDVIRRYMVRSDLDQPVKLSVVSLAERFNQPVAHVRTALAALAGETGRGVHQISGDLYEYRAVERRRKRSDTEVRIKVAEYMQKTKPGSLHKVAGIAKELGTLPASTSGALKALAQDPYLYIFKVSYGTYSYRPPGTPNADGGVVLAEPEPEPEPAPPTPAVMPPRRSFPVTGEEQPRLRPEPILPFVTVPAEPTLADAFVAELEAEEERARLDEEGSVVPEGWLKIVHTTSRGVRLAEDHEGRINKVTSIEENL